MKKIVLPENNKEIVDYYAMTTPCTLKMVADHFGLSLYTIRLCCKHHGTRLKDKGRKHFFHVLGVVAGYGLHFRFYSSRW